MQFWSRLFSFRTSDGSIQTDLFGQMASCPFLFSREQVIGGYLQGYIWL